MNDMTTRMCFVSNENTSLEIKKNRDSDNAVLTIKDGERESSFVIDIIDLKRAIDKILL